MAGFGKRVDGPGGRRSAKRDEVTIVGSAMALEGSKSIVVEDLGPRGAKVMGHKLPPTGTNVVIRAPGLDVFGRVAWADGDRRGIVFEAPLGKA